jgi:hypothetical protein
MSCYSVGAIIWVIVTKQIANPKNLKPREDKPSGDVDEYFYSPQSDVVANVPTMLRTLAYIYLVMIILSFLLVNRRGDVPLVIFKFI